MFSELTLLRDSLAAIDGVVSCRVGIESNISPSEYPLIRVVPIRVTPGRPYKSRTVEVGIYFGMCTTEAEGMEAVYESTLTLEENIIDAVQAFGGKYVETITDEDRLDTYKMMFIRCEIQADRPVRA